MRILVLILLMCSVCFGGTDTRYVNTGSAYGGDGTTSGTSGDNRAYDSFETWCSKEATDLVTDSNTHVVNFAGTAADTNDVDFTGWTTGVSNGITLIGDNTSGKWDETKYRLEVTEITPLGIREDYLTFQDMQFSIKDETTVHGEAAVKFKTIGASNAQKFERCIFRAIGNVGTITRIVYVDDADTLLTLENCLIYDHNDINTMYGVSAAGTTTLHNCTIVDCDYSVHAATQGKTVTGVNVLCCNGDTTDFSAVDGNDFTLSYCTSSDGTADDFGGVGNDALQTYTFDDAANHDYGLASNDAGARDLGNGAGMSYDNDLKGVSRPVADGDWDGGCLEYVAAGGSTIPVIMYNRKIRE